MLKITETDDHMASFRLFGPPDVDGMKAKGKIKGLIKALGDKDAFVRLHAAKALGKIGDTSAVDPLIKALGDKDNNVRKGVAEALGEIGDARAVEPLIKALEDEDNSVRKGAAKALGEISDERAIEPLIKALGDGDNDVCKGAAEALGEIGDERAIEPLIEALEGEHWLVRKGAAEALEKIGVSKAQIEKAEGVARIENNISKLKSNDWKERESAAYEGTHSFSCWWDQKYYQHLLPVIFDENPKVRKAALESLGNMIKEDHMKYAPSLSVSRDIYNREFMSAAESHFSEGNEKWKNSSYYPINQKIVNEIQRLLYSEEDQEVRGEANKALQVARSYL